MTAEVVDIAEARERRPPIIVHKPRHPRRALKTFEKHGPLTKYLAVCGQEVNIAENVALRRGGGRGEIWVIAGPHPRYYEGCRGCGYLPDDKPWET